LSDATLAQVSTIVVAVWAQTGWHAILYLAYLQSIPADYYEVATIDGANRWQVFRSITLPLLTPAAAVSTLLLMTGGLKVYDLPFALTKGGPGFATYTITQAIIDNGIAQGRMGVASALSVAFLIAVGLVVLAQLAVSRLVERRFS
jgi:ABC-type sugar transport system permease subunit